MIIKKFPEDFIVEEIPINFSGSGDYAVYKLTKINYNTESAINYICKAFNILRKNIKYGGSKDKHAVTTQYISIFKNNGKLSLNNTDISLQFISFHNEPLSLGSLKGNNFKIKIRELTDEEKYKIKSFEYTKIVFPNYFDDQRFSDNNLEIGIALLKKDFKKACNIIVLQEGNDYIGSLKKIPSKTLLFYLHAVQAYIFNKELSNIIKNKGDYYTKSYRHGELAFSKKYDFSLKTLRLVGFDYGNEYLYEMGLNERDFIIKQFPEVTLESAERECFVETTINIKTENNEVDLEFSLPKGSYATMLIKALF